MAEGTGSLSFGYGATDPLARRHRLTSMASRTKQKEEARARRLAEERALAERARQRRRLQILGGVVLAAVAIVAVAIAFSVGGGKKAPPKVASNGARSQVAPVNSLLAGIPQV